LYHELEPSVRIVSEITGNEVTLRHSDSELMVMGRPYGVPFVGCKKKKLGKQIAAV
jgi:hypothetical protein